MSNWIYHSVHYNLLLFNQYAITSKAYYKFGLTVHRGLLLPLQGGQLCIVTDASLLPHVSVIYNWAFGCDVLEQAGPSVRHKCLQAIMRMIYYASADLLQSVLTSSNVSRCRSYISGCSVVVFRKLCRIARSLMPWL